MISGTSHVLGQDDEGRRLDRILRIMLESMPLSSIHKALRKGDIRINGIRQSPRYHCRAGDILEFSRVVQFMEPPASIEGKRSEQDEPFNRHGLPILLETQDLLFLDKPVGVLVHDGSESLDAMVKHYLRGTLDASLAFVPGPLHRLDRNTTGIITFSRSLHGAKVFSEAMRQGSIRKTYMALLEGNLEAGSLWKDTISRDTAGHRSFIDLDPDSPSDIVGKEAVTEVIPLLSGRGITLAALRLQTGRTHQIRVQAASHGYPLVGDVKYGGKRCKRPYWLHAWKLAFHVGLLPGIPGEITAPLPPHFFKKLQSSFSLAENEVYSVLRQF